MSKATEITLKSIGNSQGFIIPKKVLRQVAKENEINFTVEVFENKLLITPSIPPRHGWEEAFKKAGSDELIIPDILDDDGIEL
jgi:antitoxin component of MazEF toxin-antitoxin module